MKIGIFYGSTTGHTEQAAQQICQLLPGSTAKPVNDAVKAEFESCNLLILGTSTWGLGDLQDDWIDALDCLRSANLQGKQFALFGLGDQLGYPDTFIDGIKVLYDVASEAGAEPVGSWSDVGYRYEASAAATGEGFLGLALDEDNQPELSEERIQAWVEQLLREIK